MGTTRFRHGTAVKWIGFTPDGKRMVTADGHGGDAWVRFWDVATGRQLREVPISRTQYKQAISPDLRFAAWEADSDVPPPRDDEKPIRPESVNVIDLWDLKTGERLHRLQVSGREVQGFTFSGDGKRLASWHRGGRVVLWDIRTGKKRGQFRVPGEPVALAFAPGGKSLALGRGDSKVVEFRHVPGGGERGRVLKLDHPCSGLAFAPDGKFLAVWGGGRVSIGKVATGKVVYQQKADPSLLSFSPDGKTLATAEEKGIRLWDLGRGKEVRRLPGTSGALEALAFAPDGKTLASGGFDCVVRRWDIRTGKEIGQGRGPRARLHNVAFSLDGKMLATGGDDEAVRLWEAATGRQLGTLPERHPGPDCLCFSGDGRQIASTDRKEVLRVWDVARRKLLWQTRADDERAGSAAFTPGGRVLVAPVGGEIRYCETTTGKVLRRIKARSYSLALSPDGRVLAACGDKGLEVRHAETGARSYHFPDIRNAYLAFTPDGRVLAVTLPYLIWGLEVATGTVRWQVPVRSGSLLAGNFALSPDGRVVAVADLTDTVKLFRVDTGEELCPLTGHRGPVRAVAFSPDGGRVASASFDTTALVWDVSRAVREVRVKRTALADRELKAAWGALAEKEAADAGGAVWRLIGAGDQAVGLLTERLRAVPWADPRQVTRWLRALDSAEFGRRQRATTELEKLEEQIEPELHKLLKGKPPLEVQRRVERLLARLGRESPRRLRELRAVEVLEYLNTPTARGLLTRLVEGAPNAWLTREAKAALRRLTRRSGSKPGRRGRLEHRG
jgi:WD40 repeat protein